MLSGFTVHQYVNTWIQQRLLRCTYDTNTFFEKASLCKQGSKQEIMFQKLKILSSFLGVELPQGYY